jgi:hypothetical protein
MIRYDKIMSDKMQNALFKQCILHLIKLLCFKASILFIIRISYEKISNY